MVENESMLNCEQVWREISNYVDGDVDAGLRSAMDEHFRTCAHCASVLVGTRNVVRLYGDERMLEVPAGFGQRLEKRLEKRLVKNAAGSGRGWSSWSAWLVPVAALLLIAGGVMLTNSLTGGRFMRSHHAEPANNIPPDLVVVVSDGSKLFHVPGCPFIHDKASERTTTAKEAIRDGYVPCTRCLRQYLKTGLTGHPGGKAADNVRAEAEEDQDEVLTTAGH
ncbi:MAG: zf-HC2 domain-containing protein [Candidatus Sulfotelmatobacter sp.]